MAQRTTEKPLKIGELAGRLGLNVQTVRYYEHLGILEPAARTESGYRLYSAADEALLRFVLQAKRIGFGLDEIREMVRQRRESGPPCDYVRETLHRHLEALDAKLVELQQLRAELLAAEAAWQNSDQGGDGIVCGLIEGWTGTPGHERGDRHDG
jgi:DNA-binding transcriptional MerR regulator